MTFATVNRVKEVAAVLVALGSGRRKIGCEGFVCRQDYDQENSGLQFIADQPISFWRLPCEPEHRSW
jgi:hypothetical protein